MPELMKYQLRLWEGGASGDVNHPFDNDSAVTFGGFLEYFVSQKKETPEKNCIHEADC